MAGDDRGETNLSAILSTVEGIRAEKFQGLDPTLVQSILRLHADPSVTDSDLAKRVEELVERFVVMTP
jgi:hypothetical protein